MAHNQEVLGSNPGTIYSIDVRYLLAISFKKKWNKGIQMGHNKKNYVLKFLLIVISSLVYQSDNIKQFPLYFSFVYEQMMWSLR